LLGSTGMGDPRDRVRRRRRTDTATPRPRAAAPTPGRGTQVTEDAYERGLTRLPAAIAADEAAEDDDVDVDDLEEHDRRAVQDFARVPEERRALRARPAGGGRGARETYTTFDEDAGEIGAGVRSRHAHERRDGSHEVASEADATIGPGGPEFAIRRRREIDHGGDVGSERQAEVRAEVMDGRITGSLQRERGPDDARPRDRVEGAVDLAEDGRIEGVSGAARHTTGDGREIAISAGVTASIDEPVQQPDGRWRIEGTITYTAGGSGSTGDRADAAVEGGATYSHVRTFVRNFTTEGRARAFYDHAERYLGAAAIAAFDAPDTAAEAMRMGIGDERATSDGIAVNGGASASIGQLRAGVTMQIGSTHEATVIRADRDHVQLRVRDTTAVSGTASLSVPLSSMSAGAGSDVHRGQTYDFDVSTRAGRAALDRALGGELPRGARGPGWHVTARVRGETARESSGVGVLGLDIASEEAVVEEETEDADGNRTVEVQAVARLTAETALPDWLASRVGLGSAVHRTELTLAHGGGGALESEVRGSSARDTMATLGRATGLPTHLTGVDGDGSGTWNLSAQFTDGQIRGFMARVLRGDIDLSGLGAAAHGDYHTLRTELRAAGDYRAARRAVATFVSETGSRGIELIRTQTGARPRFGVTLEGSTVFVGPDGHARTDRRIGDLSRRIASGDNALDDAFGLQRELRDRLAAMRDPAQFTDLLPDLRSQEIATVERQLARLPAVIHQAAELAGTGPMCGDEVETAGPSEAQRTALAAIARDAATMTAAQREARRVRDRVTRQRAAHDGHVDNGGFPPRDTLYAEADRYARADTAWAEAEVAYGRGERASQAYDDALARLQTVTGVEQDQLAREIRVHTWDAARYYRTALAAYRTAFETYGAIRTASLRRGEVGLWGLHDDENPERPAAR
jgi:hypothetical protein